MKTEAQIKIDFEQAIENAKRLQECGVVYQTIADKRLMDCMKKLSGQWDGYASDAYQKKAEEIRADIVKTARKLKTIGDTLEVEAKRLYEAEMKAITIAKTIISKKG